MFGIFFFIDSQYFKCSDIDCVEGNAPTLWLKGVGIQSIVPNGSSTLLQND